MVSEKDMIGLDEDRYHSKTDEMTIRSFFHLWGKEQCVLNCTRW